MTDELTAAERAELVVAVEHAAGESAANWLRDYAARAAAVAGDGEGL